MIVIKFPTLFLLVNATIQRIKDKFIWLECIIKMTELRSLEI